VTLGSDLSVPGELVPQPLPEPAAVAQVDGFTVALTGELAAGRESELILSVSRDGKPVTDLQPYLGAYGHLVALREGDLAYLHVHPGDGLSFMSELPSAGRYRLFLQCKHDGVVRTAPFTLEVPR